MSFARAAMAVAVTLAASSTAHADVSYRGTTAVSDLMGGAAFAGGIELGTDTSWGLALTVGGLTVAGLGAPVLHGAHGNPGRMAASLLLRVTLPPLGAYGGYLLSPSDRARFRHGGGLIGFMAGYAVVTIIDIAMAKSSDDPTTVARVISFGKTF
jgi:hypothetical protein